MSEKYVSQIDLFKENKKENPLKCVSMASFNLFSKIKYTDDNRYLGQPIADPTRLLKFRKLDKNKWVSPTNFVI